MFRKPIFWAIFALLSAACGAFAVRYFSVAFPIVNLDIAMNRREALERAREIARRDGLGPEKFRQAASFGVDTRVQNYVELEAGGNEAFNRMLQEGLYAPYTWTVRHFNEARTLETYISFTPEGVPYEFSVRLPESAEGPQIPRERAQATAERSARDWGVSIASYTLVETSRELQPGGRLDHVFVYERPEARVAEGRYRLRLVVGGDRLTELEHSVWIPESFDRRFQEMRSANTTIASGATITVGIVYVLGGLIGLFLLLRRRRVLWQTPLALGFVIAFMQLLAGINNWPLAWMFYDTALSIQAFMLQFLVSNLFSFIVDWALLVVSFMAAESLSRLAFPDHVQLWRIWGPEAGGSRQVAGQTAGGYLLVTFFLAYQVILYFFTQNVVDWWTPSHTLFEPDILATYLPWLGPFAQSLHAGVWEESLFRAVPLASAAIIGQRFGNRRAWIIGALILQAVVFGAAHANYPNQPAYARLVELILPSIGFGLLYLSFGLLPAMILHFSFDAVLMSLPLFVSSSPGILIDRLLIVALVFIPLWIICARVLRQRRWTELSTRFFNRAWTPPDRPEMPEPAPRAPAEPPSRKILLTFTAGGVIGLALWLACSNFSPDAPALTVGRQEGVALAREILAERGVELPPPWQTLPAIEGSVSEADRFIWREGGRDAYRALLRQEFLAPPHWSVRFARFQGNVEERTEAYRVRIYDRDRILGVSHQVPESRAGASLERDRAGKIALDALAARYGTDPSQLSEISATDSQLPARRDWEFIFANPEIYPLEKGQARSAVVISGNEVTNVSRFIHVPEEWLRNERSRRTLFTILESVSSIAVIGIFVAGVAGSVIGWSRRYFSTAVFFRLLVISFALWLVRFLNSWPIIRAGLSTAEPVANQLLTTIGYFLLSAVFMSLTVAVINGFVEKWKEAAPPVHTVNPALPGLGAGALLAGVLALTGWLLPPAEPLWPDYRALSTFVPLLSPAITHLVDYIRLTTLLLLVLAAVDHLTEGWTRKRGLYYAAFLFLGFVVARGPSPDSIPSWIIAGLVTGNALFLGYRYLLRRNLAILPYVTAGFFSLGAARQGAFGAYPGAVPAAAAAVLLLLGFSYYWHSLMEHKEAA